MTKIFEKISDKNHEQIVYCNDPSSGLKAIIAIHNTVLGPALGGCRMYPYKSEEDALVDVLRLSRGMTYKASISNLNLGGGKAVIIGDPNKDKIFPRIVCICLIFSKNVKTTSWEFLVFLILS